MGKMIEYQCDRCKNYWVEDTWDVNNFESFLQIILDNDEEVCYTCYEDEEE